MPLSIWQGLEDCLALIVARRPSAILDAGIGFGLWGHLLRQYLDVWSGRIQRQQWTTRIDGIEIDPHRVQPHSRHLYSDIYVGDIRDEVPSRARNTRYDIILFGDVIRTSSQERWLGAAAHFCDVGEGSRSPTHSARRRLALGRSRTTRSSPLAMVSRRFLHVPGNPTPVRVLGKPVRACRHRGDGVSQGCSRRRSSASSYLSNSGLWR